MRNRPFQVLGVQQVAVGHLDRGRLRELWIDLLGLSRIGEFHSQAENVHEDIAVIGSGPYQTEVDLMQPMDPNARPAVHVPALNHVGLWIDDLRKAVEWLTARGVRFAPGGVRTGASGHEVCFIHPKGTEEHPIGGAGVLIELVQAPPDVVKAYRQLAGHPRGASGQVSSSNI